MHIAPVAAVVVLVVLFARDAAATARCPDGQRAIQKGRALLSNGCGSGGMRVAAGDFDFTPSCDLHDACYDTCGVAKATCERKFKDSLTATCRSKYSANLPACLSASESFVSGTALFGEIAFQSSQRDACECVPAAAKEKVVSRYLDLFRDVYVAAGVADDGEEQLEQKLSSARDLLSNKYHMKEHELLLQLVTKYPAAIEKMAGHPEFRGASGNKKKTKKRPKRGGGDEL